MMKLPGVVCCTLYLIRTEYMHNAHSWEGGSPDNLFCFSLAETHCDFDTLVFFIYNRIHSLSVMRWQHFVAKHFDVSM